MKSPFRIKVIPLKRNTCLAYAASLLIGCQTVPHDGVSSSSETEVSCAVGDPAPFHLVAPNGEGTIEVSISGRAYAPTLASDEKTAVFDACLGPDGVLKLQRVLFKSGGTSVSSRINPQHHDMLSNAIFDQNTADFEFRHVDFDPHSFESYGFALKGHQTEDQPMLVGYRYFALRGDRVIDPNHMFVGVLEHGNPLSDSRCRDGETETEQEWQFGTAKLEATLCSSRSIDQTTAYRVVGMKVADDNEALPIAARGERTLSSDEIREKADYQWTHHNQTDSFTLSLEHVIYRWFRSFHNFRPQHRVRYGEGEEIDVTPIR